MVSSRLLLSTSIQLRIQWNFIVRTINIQCEIGCVCSWKCRCGRSRICKNCIREITGIDGKKNRAYRIRTHVHHVGIQRTHRIGAEIHRTRVDSIEIQGTQCVGAEIHRTRMDGIGIQGTQCVRAKTDSTRVDRVGIQGTQCIRAEIHRTRVDSVGIQGTQCVGT
jgi:hypothetical protein